MSALVWPQCRVRRPPSTFSVWPDCAKIWRCCMTGLWTQAPPRLQKRRRISRKSAPRLCIGTAMLSLSLSLSMQLAAHSQPITHSNGFRSLHICAHQSITHVFSPRPCLSPLNGPDPSELRRQDGERQWRAEPHERWDRHLWPSHRVYRCVLSAILDGEAPWKPSQRKKERKKTEPTQLKSAHAKRQRRYRDAYDDDRKKHRVTERSAHAFPLPGLTALTALTARPPARPPGWPC